MAKVTVTKCDKCGEWDSDTTRVRSVPVAGPRFELCANDRVELLVSMGIGPVKARVFVDTVDQRGPSRGTPVSLDGDTMVRAMVAYRKAHPDEFPQAPNGDPVSAGVAQAVEQAVGELEASTEVPRVEADAPAPGNDPGEDADPAVDAGDGTAETNGQGDAPAARRGSRRAQAKA